MRVSWMYLLCSLVKWRNLLFYFLTGTQAWETKCFSSYVVFLCPPFLPRAEPSPLVLLIFGYRGIFVICCLDAFAAVVLKSWINSPKNVLDRFKRNCFILGEGGVEQGGGMEQIYPF